MGTLKGAATVVEWRQVGGCPSGVAQAGLPSLEGWQSMIELELGLELGLELEF